MIINFTHNQALTTIQRIRLLPTWGKVLVRTGQEVDTHEIVAVANSHPKHYKINVAHGLGTSGKENKSFIKRDIGEFVKSGSIIAERKKSGRIIRSPSDGTIVSIDDGIVLLQSNNKMFELKAGFPGLIKKVLIDHGVVIESTGAYYQGVWGNGKFNIGSLTSFTSSPEEPLSLEKMKNQHNNIVSFAAWCNDPAVFEYADKHKWKGMIFGSLPAKLIPVIRKLPFPVLLTEGFGNIPINSFTYDLLNSHLGRNISVDAIKGSCFSKDRPEFFIPAANGIKSVTFKDELNMEIGNKVRILKGKYFGYTGTIADNNIEEMTKFPNGNRSQSILVNLPDDEKVVFPLANIDVFV